MAERPPAPPIPRSTLRTALVMITPAGIRRNTFYWTLDTPPTGLTDLEACCNKALTVIGTDLKKILTTKVAIVKMEGRWYGPGTTGFEADSTIGALTGEMAASQPGGTGDDDDQGTADTLPDEVSLIVQKRTGNTGRSAYGRWFFCGLSENVQNAGKVDVQAVGLCRNFANSLSNDITVTGGFATIMHARHWDKKNNTMRPITKCYAVATMGSRIDRRRPHQMNRL